MPLGVDGVERERGLAGAGQPGQDHQLISRNIDVDVFQIVDPRAAYLYFFSHEWYSRFS